MNVEDVIGQDGLLYVVDYARQAFYSFTDVRCGWPPSHFVNPLACTEQYDLVARCERLAAEEVKQLRADWRWGCV